MTEISQFLELHVSCADIGESLYWYKSLGFSELTTGDMRAHHYAVVSDGMFCIGLHEDQQAMTALTFVQPGLDQYVKKAQLAGTHFEYARLGDDEFNEAARTDPDGTKAIFLEARTFFGMAETSSIPLVGGLSHITLPCVRLEESLEFWEQHGFMVVESGIEGQAELHMPGLTVSLREGTRVPELHFSPANFAASRRAVERSNTPFREGTEGYSLVSPEGLRLIISDAAATALT